MFNDNYGGFGGDPYEYEMKQTRLMQEDADRITRARMDTYRPRQRRNVHDDYDGDPGRCAVCKRFIPHEDELLCASCERAQRGDDE